MTLLELEAVKKEVFEDIVAKISIDDSYFYAELLIQKQHDDPYTEYFKITILINLFNSKDFKDVNQISRKMICKAKKIRTEVKIPSLDVIKSKEDIMMLVYEQISKQIVMDLFQSNGSAINVISKTHHQEKIYT